MSSLFCENWVYSNVLNNLCLLIVFSKLYVHDVQKIYCSASTVEILESLRAKMWSDETELQISGSDALLF